MPSQVIAIAADHGGFELKRELSDVLAKRGFEVLDLGTHSADAVDYPDVAERVATALRDGNAERGVLICGTGIGIGIAANRFPGIRAATCSNVTLARLARQHNDANVLSLGARVIGFEAARDILFTFLDTPFDGGERHRRRIDKLG